MDRKELQEHLRYELSDNDQGCWLFTGAAKNSFHGSLYYKGKPWQAHRLAYTLMVGSIPEGKFVLHECDNGRCVNPNHLFLGTQEENIQDMIAKGRSNYQQPGSKNGRAVIKEDDVIFIRNAYSNGEITISELATKYKVGYGAIHKIVNRTTWRHI